MRDDRLFGVNESILLPALSYVYRSYKEKYSNLRLSGDISYDIVIKECEYICKCIDELEDILGGIIRRDIDQDKYKDSVCEYIEEFIDLQRCYIRSQFKSLQNKEQEKKEIKE